MSATLRRRPDPPDPLLRVRVALCSLWLALIALETEKIAAGDHESVFWVMFDAFMFKRAYDEVRRG